MKKHKGGIKTAALPSFEKIMMKWFLLCRTDESFNHSQDHEEKEKTPCIQGVF